MQYSNRRVAGGKLGRELRAADRRRKRRFGFESLEDRSLMAAFAAGNIAVLELASTSKNTTGSIVELNPSTPSQSSPVQTIAIPSSGSTPFRDGNPTINGVNVA